MKKSDRATRRAFIWTAGAAAAAPLTAVAAAHPSPCMAEGRGDNATRLALLENINAIRAVNQEYARRINDGAHAEAASLFLNPSDAWIDASVAGIAPDRFEEQDRIDIGADGMTASALVHCAVETVEVIGPDCPLLEMAREQGGGVIRRIERVVFEKSYVKRGEVWKIQRSIYRPV